MRAVVCFEDFSRLFDCNSEALGLAVGHLTESAILVMSPAEAAMVASAVPNWGLSPMARKRLEIMLTAIPVDTGGLLLPDLVASGDLVSVASSAELQETLSALRALPKPGETREAVYSRLFHRHARISSSAVIVDRYLGKNLVDGRFGASDWFLGRLAQDGLRSATFITARERCSDEAIFDQVVTRYGSAFDSISVFVHPNGQSMHDRHIRFILHDRARITDGVGVGPGLNAFRDEVTKNPYHAHVFPGRDARGIEHLLKQSAKHYQWMTKTTRM